MSLKRVVLSLFCGAAVSTGYCLVDEDLSECASDVVFTYEMHLITNEEIEYDEVLWRDSDKHARLALKDHLKGVFTDYGEDLDLSFYGVSEFNIFSHKEFFMDGSERSFSFTLEDRAFLHLAVANVAENGISNIEDGSFGNGARLTGGSGETVGAQKTGLFTGRASPDIREGKSFKVKLFMANCAAAVVLDTSGSNLKELELFAAGFADSFNISDSTYSFSSPRVIRADKLVVQESGQLCFASVGFPSKDTQPTRTVVQTADPFESPEAEETLWQVRSYATLSDGTVTKTSWDLKRPLRAGQLKILKARMGSDGVMRPYDATVGVSVTLDWNEGLDIDIEL